MKTHRLRLAFLAFFMALPVLGRSQTDTTFQVHVVESKEGFMPSGRRYRYRLNLAREGLTLTPRNFKRPYIRIHYAEIKHVARTNYHFLIFKAKNKVRIVCQDGAEHVYFIEFKGKKQRQAFLMHLIAQGNTLKYLVVEERMPLPWQIIGSMLGEVMLWFLIPPP